MHRINNAPMSRHATSQKMNLPKNESPTPIHLTHNQTTQPTNS